MRRVVVVVALLAGCLRDHTVECGPVQCPVDAVCTPTGCATQSQIDACAVLAEKDECTAQDIPIGACVMGVCRAQVCGDGVIVGNEACDDSNQIQGDGCSADCRSDESCGNGIGDFGERCDDGNTISRDGCTSSCLIESVAWRPVPLAPASSMVSAEYDADRHRVVVFGHRADERTDYSWEWDGMAWRVFETNLAPDVDTYRSMSAFDAARRTTLVLVRGDRPDPPEMWSYDGARWTRLELDVLPPYDTELDGSFDSAGMAYDPVTQRVLAAVNQETWAWDGTSWAKLDAPSPMGIRFLAFDGSTMSIVAFTGSLWRWNGTAWVQSTSPPSMVSDVAHTEFGSDGVLLFGIDGRIWRVRNSVWTNLGSTFGAATFAAFDSDRQRAVFGVDDLLGIQPNMFEIAVGSTVLVNIGEPPMPETTLGLVTLPWRGEMLAQDRDRTSATWSWFGGWRRLMALTPFSFNPLVATRRGALLFGEANEETADVLDSTWLWDGAQWSLAEPAQRPPGRLGLANAYDAARDRVVLFGGMGSEALAEAVTWEWDGVTWERRDVPGPSARTGASMAYDARRGRVVLFGGTDADGGPLGDTWEWDGTTWTELLPSSHPAARSTASMAFDPRTRRVVLAGGYATQVFDDAWEWDGAQWRLLDTTTLPGSIDNLAFDHELGALVTVQREGMYALRYESALDVPDACTDVDTDGDALAGCADPDCWRSCSPSCPPGLACDATAPHCGDAICDGRETWRICPVDCPP